MKFTNVKQLIIKFMGGGLINFPTRFLRWVKINGDGDGSDDGGDGGSTEIDYEAIYQFYKKKVIESVPEQALEQLIIPEHYTDIEIGYGMNTEYRGKMGIWYSTGIQADVTDLFCEMQTSPFLMADKYIYLGGYKYNDR